MVLYKSHMKEINILVGPRLGDLLHSLALPKYIYDKMGIISNIYMTEINDNFSTSLENTFEDLRPVIESQTFCKSFQILDEIKFPNWKKTFINTQNFRKSPWLYKTTWSQLILNSCLQSQPKVPKDFKIIELPKDDKYKNALIINRRDGSHEKSSLTKKVYKDVISQFEEVYFLYFDKNHYEEFFYKDLVKPLHMENLYKTMVAINSCKLFLGNQTGSYAMATIMNVDRIGELFHKTLFRDDLHYLNDGNLFQNVELFNMENILTNKNIYLKDMEYYFEIDV
jgi:hypothetical protein